MSLKTERERLQEWNSWFWPVLGQLINVPWHTVQKQPSLSSPNVNTILCGLSVCASWSLVTATVVLGLAAEDKCHGPFQPHLKTPLSNPFVFKCQSCLLLGVKGPTVSLSLPSLWKPGPWAQCRANSTGISRFGYRRRLFGWPSDVSSYSLRS